MGLAASDSAKRRRVDGGAVRDLLSAAPALCIETSAPVWQAAVLRAQHCVISGQANNALARYTKLGCLGQAQQGCFCCDANSIKARCRVLSIKARCRVLSIKARCRVLIESDSSRQLLVMAHMHQPDQSWRLHANSDHVMALIARGRLDTRCSSMAFKAGMVGCCRGRRIDLQQR